MRTWRGLVGATIVSAGAWAVAACVGDDAATTNPRQEDSGAPDTSTTMAEGGNDAASSSEGGTDAGGKDAADAAVPFCAGMGAALAFCADFDTVPAVDTGWAQKNVVGNAAIDLVATDFVSSPKSALFRQGTSPNYNARMTTAPLTTGGKRSITLGFKWKRTAFSFTSSSQGTEFLSIVENGTALVVMEAGADIGYRMRNDPGGASGPPASLSPPATGKWLDVSLKVVFSNAAAGSYELKIDGAVAATKSNLGTSTDAATTTMTVGLGPVLLGFANGQQPAIEEYIDNVTVTFE